MATRVVRHAVFAFVDPEGVNRLALRGQTIEIDGDELARGERFEALVADEAALTAELAAIEAAEEPSADEDAGVEPADDDTDDDADESEEEPGGSEEPSRPPKAAGKEAWVDFAVAQGADRAEVDAMSKADLIAAYGD